MSRSGSRPKPPSRDPPDPTTIGRVFGVESKAHPENGRPHVALLGSDATGAIGVLERTLNQILSATPDVVVTAPEHHNERALSGVHWTGTEGDPGQCHTSRHKILSEGPDRVNLQRVRTILKFSREPLTWGVTGVTAFRFVPRESSRFFSSKLAVTPVTATLRSQLN